MTREVCNKPSIPKHVIFNYRFAQASLGANLQLKMNLQALKFSFNGMIYFLMPLYALTIL